MSEKKIKNEKEGREGDLGILINDNCTIFRRIISIAETSDKA